jgi:hypothetical protein
VLSPCGLPLPLTCLLVTVNEARSYFSSAIHFLLFNTTHNTVSAFLLTISFWSWVSYSRCRRVLHRPVPYTCLLITIYKKLHFAALSLQPWIWMQHVSLKRWHRPTKPHGAKTQNIINVKSKVHCFLIEADKFLSYKKWTRHYSYLSLNSYSKRQIKLQHTSLIFIAIITSLRCSVNNKYITLRVMDETLVDIKPVCADTVHTLPSNETADIYLLNRIQSPSSLWTDREGGM